MADVGCDVLLVDDSVDTLALLRQELDASGYRVAVARSGQEALLRLDASTPGAILLDVQMPGMDGFETCIRIRERFDELPVIFMTGLGDTDHIVRGFEVGGNDYVTKPVALREVLARLQAHTRTARLLRATREAVSLSERAMLAFDAHTLLWVNDAARSLLGESIQGDALTGALEPLAQLLNEAAEVKLVLQQTRLHARRLSEAGQSFVTVLLTEESAAPVWQPPALTARESEVLLWVSRGKTNRDIAEILGMSPRTVNKHLEHIFEKLGVETRTAAAAAARNYIR